MIVRIFRQFTELGGVLRRALKRYVDLGIALFCHTFLIAGLAFFGFRLLLNLAGVSRDLNCRIVLGLWVLSLRSGNLRSRRNGFFSGLG